MLKWFAKKNWYPFFDQGIQTYRLEPRGDHFLGQLRRQTVQHWSRSTGDVYVPIRRDGDVLWGTEERNHLENQLVINWPINQSINRLIGYPINQLINQPTEAAYGDLLEVSKARSFSEGGKAIFFHCEWTLVKYFSVRLSATPLREVSSGFPCREWKFSRSINQSIDRSVNQSINKSIKQSVSQSINQSSQ